LLLNVTLLLSHSLTSAILLCIFLSLPRSPLFLPHFFFSMLRRPPRSTLFPYTTLSDLLYRFKYIEFIFICQIIFLFISIAKDPRSEEHTSELQSRFELVCRLLLDKKRHALGTRLTSTQSCTRTMIRLGTLSCVLCTCLS